LGSSFQAVAGYVEVYPRSVAGESRMNQAPVMEPPPLPLPILNVGETAFDEFAIFVSMGICHHFFARGFGAGEELSSRPDREPKTRR